MTFQWKIHYFPQNLSYRWFLLNIKFLTTLYFLGRLSDYFVDQMSWNFCQRFLSSLATSHKKFKKKLMIRRTSNPLLTIANFLQKPVSDRKSFAQYRVAPDLARCIYGKIEFFQFGTPPIFAFLFLAPIQICQVSVRECTLISASPNTYTLWCRHWTGHGYEIFYYLPHVQGGPNVKRNRGCSWPLCNNRGQWNMVYISVYVPTVLHW